MLIFKNKGLISKNGITIQGLSAKLGENPIGVFGTGLKYAIAIVLRNGGKITILRGMERLDFGIQKIQDRGQEFRVITMNGKKLGFTDHLGLNWKPWMAYRELYSNCRDEGGMVSTDTAWIEGIQPMAKITQILVEWPEMEAVHADRHNVILSTEPWFSLPGVDVHPGENTHVFYKGIRVYELPKKSKYTYNLTAAMDLTEDRTLLHSYLASWYCTRAVVQASNASFLRSMMLDNDVKERWEGSFRYDGHKEVKPSPQFMEIAEQERENKNLNIGVAGYYRHHAESDPNRISPFIVDTSDEEEEIVLKALKLIQMKFVEVRREEILFKSSMDHASKIGFRRGAMEIEKSIISKGVVELAKKIMYGVLLKNGQGDMVDHLSQWILTNAMPTVNQTVRSADMDMPF